MHGLNRRPNGSVLTVPHKIRVIPVTENRKTRETRKASKTLRPQSTSFAAPPTRGSRLRCLSLPRFPWGPSTPCTESRASASDRPPVERGMTAAYRRWKAIEARNSGRRSKELDYPTTRCTRESCYQRLTARATRRASVVRGALAFTPSVFLRILAPCASPPLAGLHPRWPRLDCPGKSTVQAASFGIYAQTDFGGFRVPVRPITQGSAFVPIDRCPILAANLESTIAGSDPAPGLSRGHCRSPPQVPWSQPDVAGPGEFREIPK
jgi:hypothetical protein